MGRKGSALLALAGATILTGALGSGVAGAKATSIGPRQQFEGLVNKHTAKATIAMVCLPPLSPGETGHPLGGQTTAVEPAPASAGSTGYTGSRGRSIAAAFVLPAVTPPTNTTLTFTQYGSETIPTSLTLPCSGSGLVVFSPAPTSRTARNATVSVTFGNITVDPPQPTASARTVTVTEADNGETVALHQGDHLEVRLSGPSKLVTWTEPESSNSVVLKRIGGLSGRTATGSFTAKAKGKAQVMAFGTINCSPPCLPPILVFRVNVTVLG